MHDKPRRKGKTVINFILTGGSDVVLGANSKRCGLILPCDAQIGTVNYGLNGETLATNNGIPVNANSGRLVLGEDMVAGVLTDEITAKGTATRGVTIVEYFYLD